VALRRFPVVKLTFVLVVLLVVLVLARSLWLTALGHALVHDDGPAKADIAVVLAGDYWGNRIVTAANLVRANYVPAVLVSGPPGFYGLHECYPAIQYAVRNGYPAEWFIPLPHNDMNTRDESRSLLAELRKRNVHKFLLVTSDFHTARARRIFLAMERATGGGPEMRVVAAPDKFFKPDSWWRDREGQKIFLMEWLKTVTGPMGI
jgi:uncharacterized SAM-binding protein YcdF (DUF218 family)